MAFSKQWIDMSVKGFQVHGKENIHRRLSVNQSQWYMALLTKLIGEQPNARKSVE